MTGVCEWFGSEGERRAERERVSERGERVRIVEWVGGGLGSLIIRARPSCDAHDSGAGGGGCRDFSRARLLRGPRTVRTQCPCSVEVGGSEGGVVGTAKGTERA